MERRCRINAAMGTEHYTTREGGQAEEGGRGRRRTGGDGSRRVAALRGHDVTLDEKSRQLGGLMPLAALVKGSEPENLPEMAGLSRAADTPVGRADRVRQGSRRGARSPRLSPDAVIVATGGKLTVPEVSGVDGPNVVTTPAPASQGEALPAPVGPGHPGRDDQALSADGEAGGRHRRRVPRVRGRRVPA